MNNTNRVKEALKEFKEKLSVIYGDNLKEVIVYGSFARGDFTNESDVDVLVVLEEMRSYKQEHDTILDVALEVEENYDYDFIISSVPTEESRFKTVMIPIFLNIREEGVQV